MSSVINTNVASLNSQRNLSKSQDALSTSLQRLSSGLRINSAKDDAAGLAISERMTAQIRGMQQAGRNANDGVSLAQTGESALGDMGSLVQRIRELGVQSANGTNTTSDRQSLNAELNQLVSELDRFSTTTQFNGLKLFDGTFTSATYQVGANANQVITATSANFRTSNYGTYQEASTANISVASGAGAGANAVYSATALTINGGYGSGTYTTAGTTADSAKTIATGINQATATGVRASALTQFDIALTTSQSYSINILGTNTAAVNVSFSTGAVANSAGLSSAIQAFNDKASQTGVTATLNQAGTGITLTAADGSNVNLAQTAAASGSITVSASTIDGTAGVMGAGSMATAGTGLGSVTVAGRVILDSDKSYSVVQAAGSSGLFGAATGAAGTTGASLQQVANLDITTVTGANLAIRIADSALTSINAQRAAFGALQNRFEATISNLAASVENLSAARSRIQDADFASETATLTRNQILQQAGTAMLAQANALPQNVLSLLK